MRYSLSRIFLQQKKIIPLCLIQLAKKYHPDRNKDPDAAKQFTKIGEAYEVQYCTAIIIIIYLGGQYNLPSPFVVLSCMFSISAA